MEEIHLERVKVRVKGYGTCIAMTCDVDDIDNWYRRLTARRAESMHDSQESSI